MSIDEIIVTMFSDLAPVMADVYTGDEFVYITFNYSEIPTFAANDLPMSVIANTQIHLFAPINQNIFDMRKEIKKRLANSDFTYPTVENATNEDNQHYVFECQYAIGVDI